MMRSVPSPMYMRPGIPGITLRQSVDAPENPLQTAESRPAEGPGSGPAAGVPLIARFPCHTGHPDARGA
jgi:hypothetical protein